MLPLYQAGQTIVVEERWKGLLWSAVPQRVIQSGSDLLVTFIPAGARSVVATNRDLPGTEHLTRSERKLEAMKTLTAYPKEFSETPTKLIFYRAGRWARVNLGWDPLDGRFMGWYVNFELPAKATANGLMSKDLVLDLYVEADLSWRWKDREDFETAIVDGVLDEGLRVTLEVESQAVLDDLADQVGAFAPKWRDFAIDPSWPMPVLPPQYGPQGDLWRRPAD